MKLILTFLLTVSLHLVRAQSADQKAILDVEQQRFNAQVTRNAEVMEKVLSDDLVYVHSSGQVDNKKSFIQSILEAKMVYEQIDVQEQNVRFYDKIAIVTGVCLVKAVSNGQNLNLNLRYTDAYVRKGKQWQLVTWQSLRLP